VLAKFEDYSKGFIKTDAWIDVLYADVTHKNTSAIRYQNHGHVDETRLLN
jgi:hypothetical protein